MYYDARSVYCEYMPREAGPSLSLSRWHAGGLFACSGLCCSVGGEAVWGLCYGSLLRVLCGERAAASASECPRQARSDAAYLVSAGS